MKKLSLSLIAAASLSLMACGGNQDKNTADTDSTQVAADNGPYEMLGRSATHQVEAGGKNYTVSIECQADRQHTVRDINDSEFYDNLVQVTITCDTTQVFSHTFQKSDFAGDYDPAHNILQGMAYSELSGGLFVFGAQVGDPGNDEGGTNYRVTVSTGGAYNIVPDYTQDTSSNESLD